MISQNNNLTFQMLEAWGNCTTEVRYPGCARWKGEWSHEQRAFSEYIRYDFGRTPKTIVGIPCDDAMGYPDFKSQNEATGNVGVSDCNGNFIRHYTLGKDQVHAGGTGTVVQAMAEVLQKSLLSKQEEVVIKELEPVQVAWEDEPNIKQAWEQDEDAGEEVEEVEEEDKYLNEYNEEGETKSNSTEFRMDEETKDIVLGSE